MRLTLSAVLVTILVVAACGGDDDGAGGGDDAPGTITVTMNDFDYDPAEVSLPAGSTVTLDLRNTGSLVHQWVVLEAGAEVEEEAELPDENEILGSESTYQGYQLGAGEAQTVTFEAPATGSYQIVCAVPGHMSAGMVGELTVTGG